MCCGFYNPKIALYPKLEQQLEELNMKNLSTDAPQQKRSDTIRYMVEVAMLMAVEFVMKAIGLGSVPVGPLYMSFLTVPIAVGAIILGPTAGTLLGLVFGAVSFKDALTGGSAMTSTLLQVSAVNTFILCVVMRMLMGFCVGWIFRFFNKVTRKSTVSYFIGALSAPVLNTLFFMGYICLAFFNTEYVQNLCVAKGVSNPLTFVVALVGVQGLIEAIVCCAVGGAIAKGVAVALGHTTRKKKATEETEEN